MRVLVTGGNGFIGQYVVEYLQAQGDTPVIFDRTCPPRADSWRMLGDIRADWDVEESIAHVDGVIHVAGLLGTKETIKNPRAAVDVNIIGSLNVFAACATHEKPCVYITVGNHWMQNPYSITKTTAERFAWMYNRERGTRIAVVRALNAYGPRQKVAPVRKIIPTFIRQALSGQPIEIYGDGGQIMDMIHVKDVAGILVRALTEPHENYVAPFEAGTGRTTYVKEIAHWVNHLCGQPIDQIRYLPMRPGEPAGSVVLGNPDTLKPLYGGLRPILIPLEEGLVETVEWYRTHAEAR